MCTMCTLGLYPNPDLLPPARIRTQPVPLAQPLSLPLPRTLSLTLTLPLTRYGDWKKGSKKRIQSVGETEEGTGGH